LLAPAAIGVTVAATRAPPLRMTVLDERPADRAALADLTVRVTNLGGDDLRPHFTLTTGQGMSRYWSVARGPTVLARRTSATYELRPPSAEFTLPRHGVRIRLRAFTGAPMTLSSTDVRVEP
ncbi:hypothetical protein O3Q52_23815, partial [Streptomyces sp. ActVer]|nr:hypothetical protein [Streptomyces sp. ActVer]